MDLATTPRSARDAINVASAGLTLFRMIIQSFEIYMLRYNICNYTSIAATLSVNHGTESSGRYDTSMTSQSRQSTISRAAGRILRTRWIVRAPIRLYRWRLGWLFGKRLLMLEHTGRKSGLPRYAVVEIIDRPKSGGLVIVSGFGEKAQWYRNILANGSVRIYLGGHRPISATARRLPAREAAFSLERYAERYPKAWATLRPVLENTLGACIDEQGTNLPMMLVTPS